MISSQFFVPSCGCSFKFLLLIFSIYRNHDREENRKDVLKMLKDLIAEAEKADSLADEESNQQILS